MNRGVTTLALVMFAVAYTCWLLDTHKKFWPPRWGHGIWHVLCSGAIALLFVVAPM